MDRILDLFKALSDGNRMRIVAALSRYDELCACQITELLKVTGATASRHLSVLQHAGLLRSRKDGRWIYYRLLHPAGTEAVFQWLEQEIDRSDELQATMKMLDDIVSVTREDLCRKQRGETCCPE